MTGEQILVVGLLVAAFAAGWVARGGGPRPAEPSPPEDEGGTDNLQALLREAEHSLHRAIRDYKAGLAMWRQEGASITDHGRAVVSIFGDEITKLELLTGRIEGRLGVDYPICEDLDRTVNALIRLSGGLGAYQAGEPLDAEREGTLRLAEARLADSRARFQRGIRPFVGALGDGGQLASRPRTSASKKTV